MCLRTLSPRRCLPLVTTTGRHLALPNTGRPLALTNTDRHPLPNMGAPLAINTGHRVPNNVAQRETMTSCPLQRFATADFFSS